MQDNLLTIDEAAKMLHTTPATLRYWRATGADSPRSARIGRRVLYRERDVREWLDAKFEINGAA